MSETSTKGGLFHRIKSQKQYKKITDSEAYKKADYDTKNKMLKEGGSELPKPGLAISVGVLFLSAITILLLTRLFCL